MNWTPVKSKRELASLLVWVMVNDRPVPGWSHKEAQIREYANEQSRRFGYENWVEAYHNLEEVNEIGR